ncbi:MAG TPA: ABC transporter permease [bacterium]|nr:ABC transporter permease [bacterium]
MSIFARAGAAVIAPLDSLLDMTAMFLGAIKVAFTERGRGGRMVLDVVLRQILFTGVEALRVTTITALLLGGAVIIEAFTQLPRVGGESVIGSILVIVVVRELGPIITAFIVIGRSGTAIATEIGYMMVNREVQALEMMGINPLRFVVLPRLVGVAAAIFCLSFWFVVVALFGGYVFARLIVQYPFARFVADVGGALGFWDVAVSGIKCFMFGLVVALICCYRGFSVRMSFTEIPQVTTRAVVLSIYACFAVNIIITAFFYI